MTSKLIRKLRLMFKTTSITAARRPLENDWLFTGTHGLSKVVVLPTLGCDIVQDIVGEDVEVGLEVTEVVDCLTRVCKGLSPAHASCTSEIY